MASIGAVFLPVHPVATILCYRVLNLMIQGPLPKVSFFSQPAAGLTNQTLVQDSWAGTPLTFLSKNLVPEIHNLLTLVVCNCTSNACGVVKSIAHPIVEAAYGLRADKDKHKLQNEVEVLLDQLTYLYNLL